MKRPKPNNRRPQLWIGVSKRTDSHEAEYRIRILYPDGHSAWDSGYNCKFTMHIFSYFPCWQKGRIKSFKERVKLMRKYDRERGATTEFVCNL